MGLIQELTRYLNEKEENKIVKLKLEIVELERQVSVLKEKLNLTCGKLDRVEEQKGCLLDEVALQQSRIDSLLRQLKEKNGGN